MSAAKLVAAIDHGTTSTRCILFARDGTPAAVAQREQTMYYPRAGWVELDMEQVWQRTQECIHEALSAAGAAAADVAAVGIANERESVVLWDRRTGRPVAHSITWQDTRTAAAADGLAADGGIDPPQQPNRAVDLDLLVGAQARMAARRRPGPPRRRRARRSAVRHPGHVAPLEPDRGTGRRRTRHGSDKCQPHASDEPAHARLGRGSSRGDVDPACGAPGDPLVE